MNDNALIEFVSQALPDLIAVYRFGSQAKGAPRPDSDVDLAVLARDPIPALHRFELAQHWRRNYTAMWTSWIFAARRLSCVCK